MYTPSNENENAGAPLELQKPPLNTSEAAPAADGVAKPFNARREPELVILDIAKNAQALHLRGWELLQFLKQHISILEGKIKTAEQLLEEMDDKIRECKIRKLLDE